MVRIKKLLKNLAILIAPALQIQISLAIGFLLTYFVGTFYLILNDPKYPTENLPAIALAFAISLVAFILGNIISKKFKPAKKISFFQGAWIVFFAWIISCSISSIYFIQVGFPVPANQEAFTLARKFIDGFYESMSGFSTTGSSILPSVEVFPQSVLFWRALTHWIGGMGIAYMAVTLWKRFTATRGEVINCESESPHIINFKDEEEAINSGFEFIKIYSLISALCLILLIISGFFFRATPYEHWHENIFDSTTTMFGTLGTGGFMNYDKSVGLPIIDENGISTIGGLQNPTSEWIIAFFMIFSGMNFGLWYILFFKKNIKAMFKNQEFRIFWLFIIVTTIAITLVLQSNNVHQTVLENLRYAFFNVASIISTTGFGNDDFNLWPVAAQGILFTCFLLGSCVGSTAGGLKFTRFLVLFKYIALQFKNTIQDKVKSSFTIDKVKYDDQSSAVILSNIAIYYIIFFLGVILLLITSSKIVNVDGTIESLDFVSAIAASISSLGNIGPAIVDGTVGAGPTGNFSAYSDAGKIVLITLMYIGRVGVLSFLILFIFIKKEQITEKQSQVDFDSDEPLLFGR